MVMTTKGAFHTDLDSASSETSGLIGRVGGFIGPDVSTGGVWRVAVPGEEGKRSRHLQILGNELVSPTGLFQAQLFW